MACANLFYAQLNIYILLLLIFNITGYEKTLRKIVRSQSKMIQRPFSSNEGTQVFWKNISMSSSPYHLKLQSAALFPNHAKGKMLHSKQRSKIFTILSAVDTLRSLSSSKIKTNPSENERPYEFRLPRETFYNRLPLDNYLDRMFNNSRADSIILENYYQIPKISQFFPPIDEQILQRSERGENFKGKKILQMFGKSSANRSIFQDKSDVADKSPEPYDFHVRKFSECDVDAGKLDILIEEITPEVIPVYYNYTVSENPYTCDLLHQYNSDIETHEKFSEFNIEPPWIAEKHFWNNIFNSRYESLMRNSTWPQLKVILVPRSHVDSIWKETFENYFNKTVNKILSNLVKKLQFYKNLTFTWNEISHLSQWWTTTTQKNRSAFRKLLRAGRIEITTGTWVEPDEATTHVFGLIHVLMEGHQWLKHHLNYAPKTAWLTNSVAHSPTMTYLLSVSGIYNLVFTNVHYSWEQYLAEYQQSDFMWVQSWDNNIFTQSGINGVLGRIGKERFPKSSVLTHYLQFNSAGFKACGPDKLVCGLEFNFVKSPKNVDSYNVKEKSELLLEQYSKTGTISSHNIIIAPIGGPYHYEVQTEYDFQFTNYQKIADFVNENREIYKATIEFGTPKDYFRAIIEKRKSYPSLKGDFLNFADISNGVPAYWTGYFTTRPKLKILLRRLESTLRTTEILFSFAVSSNAFKGIKVSDMFSLLIKSRETVARLHDRNVFSGTLTADVMKYVHKKILLTVKDCWYIQEVSASLISTKSNKNVTYLQKYVYRNGDFVSAFRTVAPGDQIYVFNSLSVERTEVVEFVTRNPNIRVVDHNKKDVTVQINPIWNYQSENVIKISRQLFTITFAIVVPPMALQLFKIKKSCGASSRAMASTIYCVSCVLDETPNNEPILPFNIQPIEIGDIQLENYKYRLVFDEVTGLLKAVYEKDTNNKKTVMLDYGAFKSSNKKSGMFLFSTNMSKPLYDFLLPYRRGIKSKIVLIISGVVTTELTAIFGRFLQSTVKIYNLMNGPLSKAISLETKTDHDASPNNRELEVFLSVQTDIVNGNLPELIIDNNGFQYSPKVINISRRIESNMYPMTSMVFIQDHQCRMTVLTDHAQGVTSLLEGQVLVMLDRGVLYNDGRGTGEGLAENSATYHKHIILLENFVKSKESINRKKEVHLPSLPALYLANVHNYHFDVFFIDRSQAELCCYAFLPLIKSPFPCDISVVNFRLKLFKDTSERVSVNSALLTLHRQSFTCQLNHSESRNCSPEDEFSIEKIFRNVKAVYKTNLCGTNDGSLITNIDKSILPPMELTTVRIYF